MNNNILPGCEGLRIQAEALIKSDQTPLLCIYLDPVSKNVYLMGDSESVKKVGELKALLDFESILKTTFESSKKLTFYDQRSEAQTVCSRTHSCHLKPTFQFSWEKDTPACYDDSTPAADVKYDTLPKEILRTVFSFLEPSDLQNVILVSRQWKSVADEPALWAEFRLPRKCRENEVDFGIFFELSISSKLQQLTLHNFGFQLNDNHFENLINLELECLVIGAVDLSNISEETLAILVNNSKRCKIMNIGHGHSLKLNQFEAIFRRMGTGTNLKYLDLTEEDLSLVPSSLLENALNKLESLHTFRLKLTQNQLKAIFDTMSLKVLNLHCMDFKSVGLDIFKSSASLGNLSKLSFHDSNLSYDQVCRVLELLDKSSKLKLLDLSCVDLSRVPAEFLARVLNKVEEVTLEDSMVQAHQLKEILLPISQGISVIRKLDLGEIEVARELDPKILAMAVNKLEDFWFSGGFEEFSEDQIKMIFKEMSLGTNLKSLALEDFQHIDKVEPETLARALNNVESVDLGESNLTLAQYVAFFKQLNNKTNLKTIVRIGDNGMRVEIFNL